MLTFAGMPVVGVADIPCAPAENDAERMYQFKATDDSLRGLAPGQKIGVKYGADEATRTIESVEVSGGSVTVTLAPFRK